MFVDEGPHSACNIKRLIMLKCHAIRTILLITAGILQAFIILQT